MTIKMINDYKPTFRIFNFKNRSFSWGQGVVQNKPNSVWSIPSVFPPVSLIRLCWL